MPKPRPHRCYRARPSPKYNLPLGFIMENSANHCPFCNKRFKGPYAVSGHLAYCQDAKNTVSGNEVINIINVDDGYLELLDLNDYDDEYDLEIIPPTTILTNDFNCTV